MSLHPIARLADLREDRGTRVEIGETKILLLRQGDAVRAYQADCPHAGGPLEKGAVCNGRLVCPWHKAAFAVADGSLCEPPALDALKRYPVEVVEGEVRVGSQALAEAVLEAKEDSRRFIIVGAGAAGTAAAAALREKGFAGELLLIDREKQPGYDRTALSKFVLAGDMPPDELPALRDQAFYAEQDIQRIHGEVVQLDAAARRLSLLDGRHFSYAAALLATGGEPQRLPLPGATLDKVLLLRSREDAEAILQAARPGTRAVIVGDSFIGLEAASALRKHGLVVSVVARHPVSFAKQFGERIGQAIGQLHEDNGVVFHRGCEVLRFDGDEQVQGVRLDNGEQLPAELVLLGVGVRPVTAMLDAALLDEDGGLPVDPGMRAADGLWAAGDIARFPLAGEPTRIEHWRLAQQQGRIAAQNMLGGDTRYLDVPFFWTFHFGKRIDYLGHAERWDAAIYEGEPERFEFIALLRRGEQVVAAIGCQRQRAMALLAERMRQPLAVEEALRLVRANPD
jgi:NADPH-dependent 2,4-dienoyl-CoA reductase/sulfur reductase-like enzyme/nitrite reductase/ring-hydroxylating ferredoxin subunit